VINQLTKEADIRVIFEQEAELRDVLHAFTIALLVQHRLVENEYHGCIQPFNLSSKRVKSNTQLNCAELHDQYVNQWLSKGKQSLLILFLNTL
jgi:hypothetical protein